MSDSEWQHLPDLREFLLQSPDEEDMGDFELSDPQLDSEAEVMAYFSKTSTISAQQSDHTWQRYSKTFFGSTKLSYIEITINTFFFLLLLLFLCYIHVRFALDVLLTLFPP